MTSAGTPDEVAGAGSRAEELVSFALNRLPSMQYGDGTFREPARRDSRRADRHSTRQTAIVLLGLLRAEEHGVAHPFHTGGLRARLLDDAGYPGCSIGDLALILRAESRLDGAAAQELIELIAESVGVDGPGATSGSELAWMMSAFTEAESRDKLPKQGAPIASEVRDEVMARHRSDTGLFEGAGHGPGRRFQSFESQIQLVGSLLHHSEVADDEEAGRAAIAAAEALLQVQRGDGSWPAVVDVRRTGVVEPYPLTSVNQVALAPMGFAEATRHTHDGRFLEAAHSGIDWVWGSNELDQVMLDHASGRLFRAIGRRERLDRAHLFARAAASLVKPIPAQEARRTLRVDEATNPADLGWVLEAWAGTQQVSGVAA